MNKSKNINKWSFRQGYDQIPVGKEKELREKLYSMFGVTTRTSFSKRMRGIVIPSAEEKEMIENIFKEFGITKIWGDETNARKVSRAK